MSTCALHTPDELMVHACRKTPRNAYRDIV